MLTMFSLNLTKKVITKVIAMVICNNDIADDHCYNFAWI